MGARQVSPRVVLGLIVIILGLIMLWKFWAGKLSDAPVMTGIALVLVGAQMTWLEVDRRDD